MGNKGFSPVEMIFTIVLVAVLGGIGMVAYRNIQDRAQEAAHNKDQVVLQQVMESFRITGGNMALILDPNQNEGLSVEQQAAALTWVMQNAGSGDTVKQTGQVIEKIPSDMVIVRYTGTDKDRLVATPTGAPVMLVLEKASLTSGGGASAATVDTTSFIVTRKSTVLGARAEDPGTIAKQQANAVLNPDLVGARYAKTGQYFWDEDSTSMNSGSLPGTNGTNPGTGVVGVPGAVSLVIIPATKNSDGQWRTLSSANYSYSDYQGYSPATITYFVFREDGKVLFREDLSLGTVSAQIAGSGNNPQQQLKDNTTGVIVPSTLTGSLGAGVSGFSFTVTPKELYAFPTTYKTAAPDLGFQLISGISASATGRLGHPGIAPLTADQKVGRTNISVGHPTQLKLAFAFDKTGSDGTGSKTGTVANMVDAPPAPGDDAPIGGPQIQDGLKLPTGQEYIYRYYQFGKPKNENIVADAMGYVAVYRDDNTIVKPEELGNVVLTYNGVDMTFAPSDALTNISVPGAPSGTVVYPFRMADKDGMTDLTQKSQIDNNYKISLKTLAASTLGTKGSQGAGSIVGNDASTGMPVYVKVKSRTTPLIVSYVTPSTHFIRYDKLTDYTNPTNRIEVNVAREDGKPLLYNNFAPKDIDIGKSAFVVNDTLVAGNVTNGLGSSIGKYTLGSPSSSLLGTLAQVQSTNFTSNVTLKYSLTAPASTKIPWIPTSIKPQAQLQFYFYPSDIALSGDADRDPVRRPAASNSTFTATSTSVGRILLFVNELGALPYNGSTSNNNTQTTTAPGGGSSSSVVK